MKYALFCKTSFDLQGSEVSLLADDPILLLEGSPRWPIKSVELTGTKRGFAARSQGPASAMVSGNMIPH